jgi:hypothetical protein
VANSSRLISQVRDIFEDDVFRRVKDNSDNDDLSIDEKDDNYYKADIRDIPLIKRF